MNQTEHFPYLAEFEIDFKEYPSQFTVNSSPTLS